MQKSSDWMNGCFGATRGTAKGRESRLVDGHFWEAKCVDRFTPMNAKGLRCYRSEADVQSPEADAKYLPGGCYSMIKGDNVALDLIVRDLH